MMTAQLVDLFLTASSLDRYFRELKKIDLSDVDNRRMLFAVAMAGKDVYGRTMETLEKFKH